MASGRGFLPTAAPTRLRTILVSLDEPFTVSILANCSLTSTASIKSIGFTYTRGTRLANGIGQIINFSLDIKPGESVAIVGHTGAGKSSLARLLLRFYNFQSGEIIVDDHNIRDVNLESYRKKVGYIPQTPFLWADSLENNVRYGSEQ